MAKPIKIHVKPLKIQVKPRVDQVLVDNSVQGLLTHIQSTRQTRGKSAFACRSALSTRLVNFDCPAHRQACLLAIAAAAVTLAVVQNNQFKLTCEFKSRSSVQGHPACC